MKGPSCGEPPRTQNAPFFLATGFSRRALARASKNHRSFFFPNARTRKQATSLGRVAIRDTHERRRLLLIAPPIARALLFSSLRVVFVPGQKTRPKDGEWFLSGCSSSDMRLYARLISSVDLKWFLETGRDFASKETRTVRSQRVKCWYVASVQNRG